MKETKNPTKKQSRGARKQALKPENLIAEIGKLTVKIQGMQKEHVLLERELRYTRGELLGLKQKIREIMNSVMKCPEKLLA